MQIEAAIPPGEEGETVEARRSAPRGRHHTVQNEVCPAVREAGIKQLKQQKKKIAPVVKSRGDELLLLSAIICVGDSRLCTVQHNGAQSKPRR
ncbi:hypothetical protein V5799_008450 [Amblyomma americanum]|uniref:Uncharacterized protein n=1 Tax=Amblyomma americanum TaxID=6943 RepID=A0AAQ4FEP2_AMBAM